MDIFIGAVILILYLAFICWLFYMAIESESFFSAPSLLLVPVIAMGITLLVKADAEQGPCFEYRTELMYNAALKMMMPAKVCVSRGEWVDSSAEVE